MALNTFKLYADAGLTTPITGSLEAIFMLGGSPIKKTVYIGSTSASAVLQVDSNPGITPIEVSVVDGNPSGGQPATALRMAASEAGLLAAVPGAALVLAPTIYGGISNAVPVWIDFTDAIGVTANYTDLSLTTQTLIESAV